MTQARVIEWLTSERGRLVRFCARYLRDPRDAEDTVSELTQRLLRTTTDVDDVATYVLKAARNHCLNRLRDAKKRADDTDLSDALFVAQTGPLTRLVRAERVADLRDAMAQLDASTRELLELRYGEDLPRETIATITGLATSVVKSRLYEGLEKLRERLGPRG
ncbi:MAG: sigma-70 family RNA polymerase sigma factor [Planctomycetes bacterium]|nr:sigma-70 family RNA polymerase sigma factor [Planctomycetota bacterium]